MKPGHAFKEWLIFRRIKHVGIAKTEKVATALLDRERDLLVEERPDLVRKSFIHARSAARRCTHEHPKIHSPGLNHSNTNSLTHAQNLIKHAGPTHAQLMVSSPALCASEFDACVRACSTVTQAQLVVPSPAHWASQ